MLRKVVSKSVDGIMIVNQTVLLHFGLDFQIVEFTHREAISSPTTSLFRKTKTVDELSTPHAVFDLGISSDVLLKSLRNIFSIALYDNSTIRLKGLCETLSASLSRNTISTSGSKDWFGVSAVSCICDGHSFSFQHNSNASETLVFVLLVQRSVSLPGH